MTVTTSMTPAMLKINELRDQANPGKKRIVAEDNSCVVYVYELKGKPCAKGYKGRSLKTSFHYSYQSEEIRDRRVNEWISEVSGRASSRKRKQTEERVLKVGDILKSVWGYDQTNVDFYKVVRLIGKSSVEIVNIGALSIPDGDMSAQVVPDISKIVGEPMRKRANGNSVKIESYSWASLMVPTLIMGVPVYAPSYCSWDH